MDEVRENAEVGSAPAGTGWTRGDLLARLEGCRREVLRRTGLMVVLILLAAAAAIGVLLSVQATALPGWPQWVLLGAFLLVLIAILLAFVPVVYWGPVKKFGLLCPGCGRSVLENDVRALVEQGHCEACGARLLVDAALLSPSSPPAPPLPPSSPEQEEDAASVAGGAGAAAARAEAKTDRSAELGVGDQGEGP